MLSLNLSSYFSTHLSRQASAVDAIMARVSSGNRIINAEDDAAGMSVAETLRSQVMGFQQANRNIQEALNIVKIGQDGVQDILDAIGSIRDLVVQAANGTNDAASLTALQQGVDQFKALIPQGYITAKNFRIALDGKDNADRVLHFQVGANAGEVVSVDYNPLRNTLGNLIIETFGYQELYDDPAFGEIIVGYFGTPAPKPDDPVPPPPLGPLVPPGTTFAQAFPKKLLINPNTDSNIAAAFTTLDTHRSEIMAQLTYLGSISNRLESTLQTTSAFEENVTAYQSRIRDVDVAQEMTALTKGQVLQQTAQAMLAQSNQRPLQVLDLLKSR